MVCSAIKFASLGLKQVIERQELLVAKMIPIRIKNNHSEDILTDNKVNKVINTVTDEIQPSSLVASSSVTIETFLADSSQTNTNLVETPIELDKLDSSISEKDIKRDIYSASYKQKRDFLVSGNRTLNLGKSRKQNELRHQVCMYSL